MAWHLSGTFFENCNCAMVCPCTTSALTMPPDNDRCRLVLVFHIDSGEVEGVDVSYLTVGLLADIPGVAAEGDWRVGLFMDAAASQEQADKLAAVFSGGLGGPLQSFAPLVGEMLGVEVVPIDYVDDGRRHRVKMGDAVEIEIEDFVPPQTPEGEVSKLTGMFHPANSTLTIAKATTAEVRAFGLVFSNVGKNGHSAPFSWVVGEQEEKSIIERARDRLTG
jgi:hypothetical protein